MRYTHKTYPSSEGLFLAMQRPWFGEWMPMHDKPLPFDLAKAISASAGCSTRIDPAPAEVARATSGEKP